MNPIKCIEDGCDKLISNPCGTVTSLFHLKLALEKQAITTKDKTGVRAQLREINESIKATGLKDHETFFTAFKMLSTTKRIITGKRLFVLQCVKGHINTYELECD
jgi:hypothetical protein